jgi:ribosome recycling factor
LAVISVADSNSLLIRPFDPSTVGAIDKAIAKSDVGIHPINDGKQLRLVFPPLSEERRKQHATKIKEDGENAKVRVRNARRDANKTIDSAKKEGAAEDLCKREKDRVQELTDDYTAASTAAD